jgi:DNA helicase II / ATP-dependent DNA helicase PcrA
MVKKSSTFKKPKEKTLIFKPNIKRDWSEFQKDIFKNIAKDDGHSIIEARAGSAKTTSLVESFKYVPKGKKIIGLAFNKIIQEELRSRSPSYADILTFHSLGFRAIKQRFGNVELENNKTFNIVKDLIGDDDFDLIINICDTVAFCKYGLLDIPTQIESIIDNFGIDLCGMDKDEFIKTVIKVLSLSKKITSVIDYNDMCWFPFIYNLSLGQYDYVFVDEAQDLNKSQLVMAKKVCKPINGRIITFLDSYQSLYSWRLSDNSVIEEIRNTDKTKVLSLPISYRCPKTVIEIAKKWATDIECPSTAIDGLVQDISNNELYKMAKPGCFILSRTNAPLIKICMAFIKNGQKANIQGRDVGKQLNVLIKKSKKKNVKDFLKWLDSWKTDEVAKLTAKNINTDSVLDRYECLVNLCDDSKDLSEVSKRIEDLFNDTDEKNIIILSTVHRAKGLERDDVFILKWTFRTWINDLDKLEKPNEEGNIIYVACTRTKKNLFFVNKIVAST